jgi:lipoprotein-anchoring transpeptidase ErfK/SrfK
VNPTARPSRRPLLLVLPIVLTLLGGACSGSGSDSAERSTTTAASKPADDPSDPPGEDTGEAGAVVARSDSEVDIHPARGDESVSQTLPATTGFGSARALLVTAEEDDWLEVLMPTRPNGSTGWVRRADVELVSVDLKLTIDLQARTLTLLDGGAEVLTTPVAIGSGDAPTPTGLFSVTDKLVTDDESSAYGPFALGLSGHSEVLTEFAGGDGQVGIHGTNDPSSIGKAVSHGCIRVPNDVITQLNELLPLGTPVTIS